jgi:mycothione reductase
MKYYDVMIVGGGSGTKLALAVADKGFKVALIEQETLGGTCLSHGCIPSKMAMHTAELLLSLEKFPQLNITLKGKASIDYDALMKRISERVKEESDRLENTVINHRNIDLYKHRITFIADQVIKAGEQELSAEKLFLALGSKADLPKIKGLDKVSYFTYKEAFALTKKPKKLLIIGGGPIAVELGTFYAAAGIETHFFVRTRILKDEDIEIQEAFEKHFAAHHTVHLHVEPIEAHEEGGVITLLASRENGEIEEFQGDALLIATGSKPATEGIGLERTSIQLDKRGNILVDSYLRTNASQTWAFGDCIGKSSYHHMANFEEEYLFRTLFETRSDEAIPYPPIPHAIFSIPEVAAVGKTEKDLKNERVEYIVGLSDYQESGRGMTLLSEIGFVKLLFESQTKRLLGAHIIGEEASDMIHMLIAFINMNATLEDLLKTVYVHPALPEVIRNAARNALIQSRRVRGV